MTTKQKTLPPTGASATGLAKLREQYGCGPVQFSGSDEALYERHLIFDNVVNLSTVTDREQFEAVAHSVRDLLSRRWVRTEDTYRAENPKHSISRSLDVKVIGAVDTSIPSPIPPELSLADVFRLFTGGLGLASSSSPRESCWAGRWPSVIATRSSQTAS